MQFYSAAASISQRIPVIFVRKKSCSGASLLLLLLPSIHEKTIYGVNVMGAIRKLFSYWFSLKWEENGAAFFFGGNFALFSCGNSTAWTVKNVIDHRLSIKCTLTPLPTSLLMNQFPSDQ